MSEWTPYTTYLHDFFGICTLYSLHYLRTCTDWVGATAKFHRVISRASINGTATLTCVSTPMSADQANQSILAIALVIESSLTVAQDWPRPVFDYCTQLIRRLSEAHPNSKVYIQV